jgi:hypothetical protein
MPNWRQNRLIIRIPDGDDETACEQFEQLREFLAGTLRDNADWVFKEPDGSWCRDSEVTNIGCRGLFWGWEFAIEDLGTHGATLSFLTKWSPPVGWVRRIHERYPAWRLRHGYFCFEWASAGFREWNGTEWIGRDLSPDEVSANEAWYEMAEHGGPKGEPFESIHRSAMEQVDSAAAEGNLYVLRGIKFALDDVASKIKGILRVQDPVYHAHLGEVGDQLEAVGAVKKADGVGESAAEE